MMKLKWRFQFGISLVAALVLILTPLALADNTVPDGDGTTPVAAQPLNLGTVCLGSTVEDDALIAISRNGNYASTNVFEKGTTVTISVQSVTGDGLSASMTATNITLPSNWDSLPMNTMSDAVASHVTFAPTAAGSFSGSVLYRATGTSSKDGTTLTREGKMDVTASVVVCDTTPPEITSNVSGTPGNNGWYVSDVTVSWTVTDQESAITSTSGCGSTTINYDTDGTTLTCSATSAGGTSSQSVTIKRDATAPSISASVSPPAASTGWWNIATGAPTVSFTCSDAMSGLAGACPSDHTFGEGADQSYSQMIYDKAGNSASAGVSDIDVDLTAPTISGSAEPDPNANGWNNTDVAVSFTCDDSLSGIASCSPSQTLSSEGADQSATGTAVDNAGNSTTATVSGINIDKTAPTLTIVVPAPYDVQPLGTALNFSATDGLSGLDGTAMAKLNGGTPQKSGDVPPVGVYTVVIYATDKAGNTTSETRTLVIYDPSAGFVTGGGWIMSPAGAYTPDPLLTGKATFGFVSKYLKNATVPTGETQFQFHAGSLNFHSVSYEWLVVTGSNYARYKGSGTVNGVGGYKFMLWAGDGTGTGGADTFRIRIWQEDDAGTETVLYDNGTDQAIGSGSIVVHTGKK